MIVAFIDDHRHEHGVEPICRVLTTHGIRIAPSTYYAFRSRPASGRALTDAGLVRLIAEVHEANYGVYGVRKVWHELRRQGHTDVARCTVERLMRTNGLRGVSKAKAPRTTIPAGAPTPEDKVNRQFTAQAPDRLWVADITYVRTFAGWVYAAFILDMCTRMIVGWQLSTSLHTRLALDALDMAIWSRRRQDRDLSALIHHSDKGVQGGFNWSSQHPDGGGVVRGDRALEHEDRRCSRGEAPAVACGPGVASGDAFPRTTAALTGGAARVLARHRDRCHDGRGFIGGGRVVAGGDPLVSSRWRDATDQLGRAYGPAPELRGA